MVLFFYLCNYTYEQVAGLAAQPPHLKEQRDKQMRLWRGVSKCMVTCIFGGIDSTIMESSRQRELLNEVLLQGVFLEG